MLSWITPRVLKLLMFVVRSPRVDFSSRSFVTRALAGEFEGQDLDEVLDTAIDAWHNSNSTKPLHEFLGFSWNEYVSWVEGWCVVEELLESKESSRS